MSDACGAGGDGNFNLGPLSDPQLNALIERIRKETQATTRNQLITTALLREKELVSHLPLYHHIEPWAMRKTVQLPHRADNQINWRVLRLIEARSAGQEPRQGTARSAPATFTVCGGRVWRRWAMPIASTRVLSDEGPALFQAAPKPEPKSKPAPEPWTLRLASGLVIHTPPTLKSLSTYVLLEQERWFEPEMGLLPLLLAGGVLALDIGANHGVVALEMARVGAGHVWAFEPTHAPRAALARSVASNGLTERITVVAAGLADVAGEACFDIQDNSELNSRHGRGAPEPARQGMREQARQQTGQRTCQETRLETRLETVAMTTLDAWHSSLGDAAPEIGFIKLDAEGDETRVLAGGQRFFERQSPVVLFELKHSAAINHALLDAWHVLGYAVFRWSDELALLRPFDVAGDELTFALNLVAVRPPQQACLAARGLLATPAAIAQAHLPAAPRAGLSAFNHALSWWAKAHFETGLSAAQRVLALLQAGHDAAALDSIEAGVLRLHTLHALGRQHAAVTLGTRLLARWGDGALPDLVAPPLRRDLQRARTTTTSPWLQQLVGEYVATHRAFSAYFMPPAPQHWAALMQHPDHDAGIERRWLLAHAGSDRLAPAEGLAALRRLPSPEHTANPGLWHGLIESMRVTAPAPAGAPSRT